MRLATIVFLRSTSLRENYLFDGLKWFYFLRWSRRKVNLPERDHNLAERIVLREFVVIKHSERHGQFRDFVMGDLPAELLVPAGIDGVLDRLGLPVLQALAQDLDIRVGGATEVIGFLQILVKKGKALFDLKLLKQNPTFASKTPKIRVLEDLS